MKRTKINDVRRIDLPKFLDARGNLSFAENYKQIPFEIKRTYWIYDVPGGEDRGGHAFRENQELIIALSGAFDVVVDDGKEKKLSDWTARIMDCISPRACGARLKISRQMRLHWSLGRWPIRRMTIFASMMNS